MVNWTPANSADPERDFNADPTGQSPSTKAFQDAVKKAQDLNVPVILQPCSRFYLITNTIEFTKPVPILGAGRQFPIKHVGPGSAFRFLLTGQHQFHDIRDLTILPAIENGGTHGIEVVLSREASLGYFNWHRIHIGPFGSEGVLLDNSAGGFTLDDGFYIGSLEDVYVNNGLKGVNIGDSLVFTRVKVHGNRQVYLSGVQGQREVIWRDGQISTRGGFLNLSNIGGFRSENMWYEHPSYLGGFTGPRDSAYILLDNVREAKFNGDTLAGHIGDPTADLLFGMIGTTIDVTIRDEVFLNRGSKAHIYGHPSTSRIRASIADNKFNGLEPVISLEGSHSVS